MHPAIAVQKTTRTTHVVSITLKLDTIFAGDLAYRFFATILIFQMWKLF